MDSNGPPFMLERVTCGSLEGEGTRRTRSSVVRGSAEEVEDDEEESRDGG